MGVFGGDCPECDKLDNMDKIEPYDYLEDTFMSGEDIAKMIETNPYKRYMRLLFIKVETTEHKHFNQVYSLGFTIGVLKLMDVAKILQEKGMDREEVRQIINQTLGKEVLKPKNDG